MAIYRIGQASMDADGYITGYGTKWKTALTLIRPGATIVFASNPVAYATISEIINDTSLRATASGGAVVPKGDYVILLHDSLTVDGLAQDVAETLRYYQGKETMYEQFVEFLKNFDWERMEQLGEKVYADSKAAEASANAAKASETNANASKNAAAGSATTASQKATEAANSAGAAKTSETNANASKTAAANSATAAAGSATTAGQHKDAAAASASAARTSEGNASSSKNAAAASASAAKTSETNAKASETSAAASKNAAKTSEDNAAASKNAAASSASAASGSATAAAGSATKAKQEADRAASLASQLDATNLMRKDANLSDVQDKAAGRKNIEALYMASRSLSSSDNLNNLKGIGKFGEYFCGANAIATAANNYPVAVAGYLKVMGTTANGAEQTIQEYTPYNEPWQNWRRSYNLVSGSTWAWSKWERQDWRAGDWVSSLKDIPGEGAYRIKGDGADVPTVGAPPGSGNNILNLVVSEVYNNAWLLFAYSGGNDMWIGRYNPQDATPAPVWSKMVREGSTANFGTVYTTGSIEANLRSDDPNTPAPSFVSRRRKANGETIVSAELRSHYNGSVELIKRDAGGAPRSIQITANNEVQFNSLVPVPANMEVGKANPNAAAYVDFHYGAKYDYDARIICDGMNSDQNGGGNLRILGGYLNFNSKGSYNFEGGRFRVTTSDVSIESPTTISHDSNALNIRPKTAGNAHYIRFNDANKDTGWVGNPSNTADTIGLFSYVFNAGVQISDRIRLTGRDTEVANLFVNGSSAYIRGGAGTANTHLWLQNNSGKNRAVIYSNDTQVLNLRSDNSGTGASGQTLSFNGATGEARAVKFTSTSDERAKFWIKPVTGALDKICSLRGVTYSMHTTIQNTVRNAGVIAQDVQKVLPEAVSVNEDGMTLDKQCRQVENALSLDYNALSALYVEAFKEMRDLIEAQKAEIESLKSTIASLQAAISN